ncbi:MAG: NAD(P)H-dependent glycerol-3-phosphate dehydrogenase [Pseudanabaena frigida]|uniref:Glycerol-3-phosphate dehydrogenase [NAD(P)+] n=1 Tax=Pseudanabaena frigida TaxID=945775 RepID=A0A2W4W8S7_9CYAN|nr:MAG: NAD(P)H-dependent glycerol-3-phosphate dehydrogenase [Pseudanabaena frigida]
MKSDLKNVTIIGSGAWGSALASLVQTNHHHVQIWSRQSKYSLAEVVSDSDAIISAVSIKGVRFIAEQLQLAKLLPHAILVSATKGLEPITRQTPSQIWQSLVPDRPLVVLSGPNLSKEIMEGKPAATVVASKDEIECQSIQSIFASRNFRVYTNSDPIGVELGGTLKNVIAIAVGACDGLNLGTNAKSALITRSLIEIIRVGVYFGAQPETFWGLSGLGDLLATCNSNLSRNYQIGYAIAQGQSLDEAIANVQGTAEGVNTANVLIEISDREKISVPVSRYVYRLLKGEITLQQAIEGLMERELKPEN